MLDYFSPLSTVKERGCRSDFATNARQNPILPNPIFYHFSLLVLPRLPGLPPGKKIYR